jgi:hypothetical protein
MSQGTVLVDLESVRQQRRQSIVALCFGGICIPTPDGPAAAAIAAGDEVGEITAAAILAGAEMIQVVYRGGNYEEARAAIAGYRTPENASERQERTKPGSGARASLR